jgi:DNA modification methylase
MYSDDPRDMSNNKNYDSFLKHFEFLIPELLRVTKEGRLVTMHITQLSKTIGKDGFLDIVDFRGDLISCMKKYGWRFHGEVVIAKDPKIIAQRTKNMQLLHATTKKDSCINRPAFNDYMLTFKKAGINTNPVNHEKNGLPFNYWCKIAEGVWPLGDIDSSDVINVRDAKATNDEKHLTPTQKEPLKRHLELYTNPNDLIYSPFSGAGTDGVVCLENNRRFKGCELKESYSNLSIKHYKSIGLKQQQTSLF